MISDHTGALAHAVEKQSSSVPVCDVFNQADLPAKAHEFRPHLCDVIKWDALN